MLMNQLDHAVSDHTRAIQLDPKVPSYWNDRSVAYLRLKKPQVALADCAKAVELDAKFASPWFNRGEAYRQLGQWEQAAEAYRTALELKTLPAGDNAWSYRHLAHMLTKSGKKEEARKHYEQMVQWFHTNDPYNAELGRLCTETEELLGVFAAYKHAVLDTPKSAEAHNRLGCFLLHSKRDTDAAMPHLREAIRLDPKLIEAHFNLGFALQGKAAWREAAESFQKVVRLQPTYRNARDAAVDSLNMAAWGLATNTDPASRDPKLAVKLAKEAVELAPRDGLIWNTLGVAQYRAGKWKDAIASLEKSMEIRKGGNSDDWLFLAMAHWQLGTKDAARKWYHKAAAWMDKNQPKSEELRRFRAEATGLLRMETKKKSGVKNQESEKKSN
jgi:tetratricopeptide (TPR) repeat protein